MKKLKLSVLVGGLCMSGLVMAQPQPAHIVHIPTQTTMLYSSSVTYNLAHYIKQPDSCRIVVEGPKHHRVSTTFMAPVLYFTPFEKSGNYLGKVYNKQGAEVADFKIKVENKQTSKVEMSLPRMTS